MNKIFIITFLLFSLIFNPAFAEAVNCKKKEYSNSRDPHFKYNFDLLLKDIAQSAELADESATKCLTNYFHAALNHSMGDWAEDVIRTKCIPTGSKQMPASCESPATFNEQQKVLQQIRVYNHRLSSLIEQNNNQITSTPLSAVMTASCENNQNTVKDLIQFGVSSNNIGLVLACCGNSAKDPGLYLKEYKGNNYKSCVGHFKNGVPNDTMYSSKLSPLDCIGAGLSQAWDSLKENASGLWDMVRHPIASASELAEFGKLLLGEEGRSQIYHLIRQAIEDKAQDFFTCLTKNEKEEATCKMAGAFVSNFIPPALLIKTLLTTMKVGKVTKLMSEMVTKVINVEKKATSPSGIRKIFLRKKIENTKLDINLEANNKIEESLKRQRASTPAARDLFGQLPKMENSQLNDAKIIKQVKSTQFDSGQTLFKGANNNGIEILELKGEKIFSKIKFPPSGRNLTEAQIELLKENFINESKFVKTLSDLGLGPKFKGVYKGKDGKYRIATAYVDGFEVHLGQKVDEIKKLELSTIKKMKEMALSAVNHGIRPGDLQFRVGHDGVPYIIDPELFSIMKPGEKARELETIEKNFNRLIKDKMESH